MSPGRCPRCLATMSQSEGEHICLRPLPSIPIGTPQELEEIMEKMRHQVESRPQPPDMVNHPPHYRSTAGMEVIDVIEAFTTSYHLGAAIKYILRCTKKGNEKEDLEKAIWYIKRHISRMNK